MSFKKFVFVALFWLPALLGSACTPLNVNPDQEAIGLNHSENILDLLDPNITTEEQAFTKAEATLNAGNEENALFYYLKTLQFNKNNINALERIAAIHSRNHHPELALKIYQDILAIDKQNQVANENLGLYFLDKGQNTIANNYLTAVLLKTNSWKAHNGLGVISDLENKTAEAITHYRAALELQPTNPMLLNNLGYSYYLSGDDMQAKTLFNQALSNDNRYQRAIHNLALIEIKHGNSSAATALFNRIMPPQESYNNVGYINMLLGQYEVAEEYLVKANDESPVYFPKAQENLNTLATLKKQAIKAR